MTLTMPPLPVLGWSTFRGATSAGMPTLLDSPRLHFTSSGRAALLLALRALAVRAGDRVLVPSYHPPTIVGPVLHLGAEPVFYPIGLDGAVLPGWLAQQDLRCVRALVAVHFFGLPQALAALRAWCDAQGIALVEDCAHALFGLSDGRAVGEWGHVAIGSLTKFLPLSSGGCLLADKAPRLAPASIAEEVRLLLHTFEAGAVHRRLHGINGLVRWMAGSHRRTVAGQPIVDERPALSTLANVDEAGSRRAWPRAGRGLLWLIPRARIVARRRQIYVQLAERLTGLTAMRPLLPRLPADCAPYVFPLWVGEPDPGYARLRRMRMPVARWDWPWPGVPTIVGDQGVAWSRHVIQIGCHQDLRAADVEQIIATLREVYPESAATAVAG